MAKKKVSLKFPKAHETLFTLHVSLDDTSPLVWRRIAVPGFFTLEKLHSIIQLSMGWQMSHLYDFDIGGVRYSEPSDDDFEEGASVAASLVAALKDNKSFTYNYDFGDGWQHTIAVESVKALDNDRNYPLCVDGENACPPEDSGGTYGFESFKEIISNPDNPKFEEMMHWVGGHYVPSSFDPNRINRDMLWIIDWRGEPNDQGLYLPFNQENG